MARMVRQGRSQADLAQTVGISQKHLSQMMNGKAQGTLEMWQQLLEAVGSPFVGLASSQA
jgi:transcriptional regulator with XRE-family HTH domain